MLNNNPVPSPVEYYREKFTAIRNKKEENSSSKDPSNKNKKQRPTPAPAVSIEKAVITFKSIGYDSYEKASKPLLEHEARIDQSLKEAATEDKFSHLSEKDKLVQLGYQLSQSGTGIIKIKCPAYGCANQILLLCPVCKTGQLSTTSLQSVMICQRCDHMCRGLKCGCGFVLRAGTAARKEKELKTLLEYADHYQLVGIFGWATVAVGLVYLINQIIEMHI